MLFDYTPTVNGEEFSHGQEMESSNTHTQSIKNGCNFSSTCSHMCTPADEIVSANGFAASCVCAGATLCGGQSNLAIACGGHKQPYGENIFKVALPKYFFDKKHPVATLFF